MMIKTNTKFLLMFFVLVIFVFFSIAPVSAQTISDSLEYIVVDNPVNNLSTKFDKELNTYLLSSGFLFNKEINKVKLNLSENYNSTFIKSAQKSTRDEHFLTLSTAYKINNNFSVGLNLQNKILSDNRKIEINQASSSDGVLFTMFKPDEEIYLTPYFGYSNDRQIGQIDNGFVYGAEGLINNLLISDFDIISQFKYKNEDISPRKNTNRYLSFLATNNFSPDISNSVNLKFNQSRRDFYYKADSFTSNFFNVDNNIQSRIETSYLLQERLNYRDFIKNFNLDLLGKVMLRSIDRNTRYRSAQFVSLSGFDAKSIYDTKINELKLDFESTAYYNSKLFNGEIKLTYGERDEKHITKNFPGVDDRFFDERSELETQKNNNAIRITASMSGNFNFSSTDILTFSLYQNKLQYDTPSDLNFDDRDELLSIVRLRYNKLMSPYFISHLSLEGTLNKIVYIFSEKSSNNNINRVLKLSAGGYYLGKKFTSSNNFEVSANYTVYDFEAINPNYKSYSFRQFTATDSSSYYFNKRFGLRYFGYVKLSEQGSLKWREFLTSPDRFLTEIFAEPKLIFNYNALQLSAGARYFSLKTYNYKGKAKIKASEYLSLGPITEILFNLKNNLYIRIYGWYEFITTEETSKKQQANLSMQMDWNF